MEELTGNWKRVHNEQFQDVYSPTIFLVTKSRRMSWAGHVACMRGGEVSKKDLMGKPEGKRPLGRPRLRWGITLKWIFKKLVWKRGFD
jgi:hypothetical protein